MYKYGKNRAQLVDSDKGKDDPTKRSLHNGPTQQTINIDTSVTCHKCGSHIAVKKPRGSSMTPIVILIGRLFCFIIVITLIYGIYLSHETGYDNGYKVGYNDGYVAGRAALAPPPIIDAAEGGPCRRWVNGYCVEAKDVKSSIQWSRYYLHRGDAESAIERWDESLRFYRYAMNLGSPVGAQAAIYAAKRTQFQSMTCEYGDESLARISRDYSKNPLGDLIQMREKQEALRALGYYNGNVDNRHGAKTRAAVREFQADLWFDQTGVLSAEQTVLLVCAGAQVAKNQNSQNILGIMYATGLGVRQNTDFALNWLEIAAQRGDADALWNLAIMYGTGTVLSSVQLCDAIQNAERADSYLIEAARAGHPLAKRVYAKYSHLSPRERWRKISGDLNQPEALNRVGRGCNPND